MKIYTGAGDEGETSTLKGRISKGSLRIEVLGGLDELASFLALAHEKVREDELKGNIKSIIKECHLLMADLAGKEIERWEERVKRIEKEIDNISKKLPELKGFVMETGSEEGAVLHISRAVCRRVERKAVRLKEKEGVRGEVLKYLNRLSDLLFVMARYVNYKYGKEEHV